MSGEVRIGQNGSQQGLFGGLIVKLIREVEGSHRGNSVSHSLWSCAEQAVPISLISLIKGLQLVCFQQFKVPLCTG
ncbi:hypothetical protein F183_A54680 (plasmid) [Bryobacterales bacterium F-183]|nr:hypothetical protein F183_A54680 [Bryobacterales bacterium F-183]